MARHLGNIDWYEVQNLVELSYGLVAPRTLAKNVAPRTAGPSRASNG